MYHPRLRGNHHDMGRHYGELLAKSGIDLSPVLAIPEQQTAFGLSCLPIYEEYLPDIMQEVRGLADGLGQRYEAVACWLFAPYCFESDHGCSVFAVRSGEHTYFGRNMDMFPEYKKTSESVLYMPENKNIFLAHSTAMMREILEQMLDSDLLLFSYPLYCYGMPAMLKNLIDRTLPLSSMAMAEVNGRHVHVGQWDYSHLRYLMICGCGFPNSKRNFEPAVRQFELLFPPQPHYSDCTGKPHVQCTGGCRCDCPPAGAGKAGRAAVCPNWTDRRSNFDGDRFSHDPRGNLR